MENGFIIARDSINTHVCRWQCQRQIETIRQFCCWTHIYYIIDFEAFAMCRLWAGMIVVARLSHFTADYSSMTGMRLNRCICRLHWSSTAQEPHSEDGVGPAILHRAYNMHSRYWSIVTILSVGWIIWTPNYSLNLNVWWDTTTTTIDWLSFI